MASDRENSATSATQPQHAVRPALTRWKIAVNCCAVALCMLGSMLMPSAAVAEAAAEAVAFARVYGSVFVAALAIITLVLLDMAAWPVLSRAGRR